ncbi:MAG TPA: OPT/YSL family transporter [Usitatibacter sp.]|nr:OPT/YSL family transporter [Usitatibacter sp.]
MNEPRWSWLPAPNTWKYHALLLGLGIFVLGPLGGVTASYMNFSLGFYIGGQVLAGILGSTVTYGYGAEGKHGANYIQTAAASVASLSAMGVLIQALVWMGLPQPPVWQLILYFLCIGMFAAGVGMLYTPILVDRMQLQFPSGLAVANILRALTDPVLLKRSVNQLGGGMATGFLVPMAALKVEFIDKISFSASTFGAGMVVGARIGIPAITAAIIGDLLTPWFISIGWLQEGDPYRKITFLIALGMIMGAALLDISLILWEFAGRLKSGPKQVAAEQPDWKKVNTQKLVAWVAAWGIGVIATGHVVLQQPLLYLCIAVALVFVFVMVNGISLGLTDSNPISSAFVVSVLIMATAGLTDPGVGLLAGAIMLISTNTAADMQQDRSTGWRLGTNRVMQFRYQAAGILMGAIMGVVFAKLFMAAYPVLLQDQTVMKAADQPAAWSAAMTYKFVGVLRSLTQPKPYQLTAIWWGVGLGLAFQLARKIVGTRNFIVDAVLLPSPYAFSFGGFVNYATSMWFGGGGVASSLFNTVMKSKKTKDDSLPEDMSTTSLVGGGLIAGDAIAALGIGIFGLLTTLLKS